MSSTVIENKYDIVVIGAGLGGLSSAAHAAIKGKKVLVLERHNIPGGSSTGFVRGRFEFESSLHEMAMIGPDEKPGLIRQLIEQMGVKIDWHFSSDIYRALCIDEKEPFDITLVPGVEAFCDDIEKAVPGSRESVHALMELGGRGMNSMMSLAERINYLEIPFKHLDFLRLTSHTAKEVMDALEIPPLAQDIISTYWPYVGEPVESIDAMTFMMIIYVYVTDGGAIPDKVSHELSLGIDRVIRNNGGDIWYNAEVTNVLIENNEVKGVVANGKTILCNHVISNAFPDDVFGHMVEESKVPQEEIKRKNARSYGVSFVIAYLGLNRSKEELGIKDYTLFLEQQAKPLDQYKASLGLDPKGSIIINCMNVLNPDASPKGTSIVWLTTMVYSDVWKDVKPEEYRKKKYEVAEKMIGIYEKATGITVKPFIEEIEVATPVTFARYLNTPNGTPYGYQIPMWDSMIARSTVVEKEQSIKGLRFVGAHAERGDGYSPMIALGEIIANRTIKDIEKEGK